jgi:hypothetical protein
MVVERDRERDPPGHGGQPASVTIGSRPRFGGASTPAAGR